MTDIGFYHLTRSKLDSALPKLLEKVLQSGVRAVVRAGSDERVAFLNAALWTYDPASFLPHGSAREGDADAGEQPIWLTAEQENPNRAEILVMTDSVEAADIGDFARCLEMFDGNDAQSVEAARARWRTYRDAGHALTYWQQNERGGWEKKDV